METRTKMLQKEKAPWIPVIICLLGFLSRFIFTRLPYRQLVGGVFSIRREHFQKVNGYSNLYWGWGAEDDDMYLRMNKVGLKLLRPAAYIGRYKMIRHSQSEVAPYKWRQYLLKTVKKRFTKDGLNSVEYDVVFINNTAVFTHIMVDIGQPPKEVPSISKMIH